MISPLAKPSSRGLRVERARKHPIHGLAVHSCGTGIYDYLDPVGRALDVYANKANPFAHYVDATAGRLIAVADEDVRSWHAGIDRDELARYQNGRWRRRVSPAFLEAWVRTFPSFASPLDLVPGDDPNEVLISVEIVPMQNRYFEPMQYESLARLVLDVWARHGLPAWQPWQGAPRVGHWPKMRSQGRLVGHEDLEPLARSNGRGGWCPGATGNARRFFDWNRLFVLLEQMSAAV